MNISKTILKQGIASKSKDPSPTTLNSGFLDPDTAALVKDFTSEELFALAEKLNRRAYQCKQQGRLVQWLETDQNTCMETHGDRARNRKNN